MWAIRFLDQDQSHLYWVIVPSRNMTLDRSSDTASALYYLVFTLFLGLYRI